MFPRLLSNAFLPEKCSTRASCLAPSLSTATERNHRAAPGSFCLKWSQSCILEFSRTIQWKVSRAAFLPSDSKQKQLCIAGIQSWGGALCFILGVSSSPGSLLLLSVEDTAIGTSCQGSWMPLMRDQQSTEHLQDSEP